MVDPVNNILGGGRRRNRYYRCSICRREYTQEQINSIPMSESVSWPSGAKFGRGYAQIGVRLPCGHWMLDDRSSGCPQYVRRID